MASSSIHLAVAKKYLESNAILNKKEFLQGTLYPDTVTDKNISHYSDLEKRGKDNVTHLAGKVNLYRFLLDHEKLSDEEFGWFLHLVTDYIFFDECFTKEYLLTHTFQEFQRDLYFSYDCLNGYIINKYGLTLEDYTIYPNQFFSGKDYQECLFSKDMIDDFILRVSSIDFEQYVKKIKLYKGNIKPY